LSLDLGIRSYSGIFLPNPDGNDLTLRSGGNANPNVAILNGSLTVAGTITGNIDATNINSGVLDIARIPSLSADKITSGTLAGNLSISGSSGTLLQVGIATGSTANIDLSGHVQLKEYSNNNLAYLQARDDTSSRDIGLRIRVQQKENTGRKTVEALTISPNGNLGIGTSDPKAKLDISTTPRTDTHPTAIKGLYITGDFKADSDGIEFRHSNGSQGIGFGYNTIYAAGTNDNQDLNLKPKGTGKVIISNLYDVYLRGSAFESTEGNITFLKIANFDFGLSKGRGLNTIVLNPNGAYKRKVNHDVYADPISWNNWADWVNANASAGDIVAVASFDAISKVPTSGSANTLLRSINALKAFQLVIGLGTERTPYTVFFVKGESTSIEASSTYRGLNAHLKTTSYFNQLALSSYKEEELWIDVTFQNNWVNYGNGYNPPAYFKDSSGIVHLRGMVMNGTIGSAIFTLPAGYRPQFRELQAVQTNSNTIGRLDILTDGQVQPLTGSNVWFSLDGVTFRAAG
jgi:hypothetical protein